jgi:hypothetical protein
MTPSMDLYGGDTARDPAGPVYAVAVDNNAPPPAGSSLLGTFGSITVWQQPARLLS